MQGTVRLDLLQRSLLHVYKVKTGIIKQFLYLRDDSYHEDFLKAEELCNEVGGYLADVLDNAEADFIKSVLNIINPKVAEYE